MHADQIDRLLRRHVKVVLGLERLRPVVMPVRRAEMRDSSPRAVVGAGGPLAKHRPLGRDDGNDDLDERAYKLDWPMMARSAR